MIKILLKSSAILDCFSQGNDLFKESIKLISDPESNLYPNGHFRNTLKDLTVKETKTSGDGGETKSCSQNQPGINQEIQV